MALEPVGSVCEELDEGASTKCSGLFCFWLLYTFLASRLVFVAFSVGGAAHRQVWYGKCTLIFKVLWVHGAGQRRFSACMHV
jgi:hypothetical protein